MKKNKKVETSIGERIAVVRKNKGVTQYDMAKKLGVDTSLISHIERGQQTPSYNVIVSLLTLYPDIDANWLIKGYNNDIQLTHFDNQFIQIKMVLKDHDREYLENMIMQYIRYIAPNYNRA